MVKSAYLFNLYFVRFKFVKWLISLLAKKVFDKNTGKAIKIPRPILKPYNKDRFELVADYELKIVVDDCDRFLYLGKADLKNERVQGALPTKRNFLNGAKHKTKSITIPAGYKTNGANIPHIFWSIFPPNSPEYLSAVVVHDYLCDLADEPSSPSNADTKVTKLATCKLLTRYQRYAQADEILKEMMSALGCNRFKVACFYYSCRAWHKLMY